MASYSDLADDRNEARAEHQRLLNEARAQLAETCRKTAAARDAVKQMIVRIEKLEAANAALDQLLGRKP
jgi:hypothetical protein